jgi:hypothetical protein
MTRCVSESLPSLSSGIKGIDNVRMNSNSLGLVSDRG